MPTGSFDLSPGTIPIAGTAAPVGVFRFNPNSSTPYGLLPNVRCLQMDFREGPTPPTARFQYITDNTYQINFGWPSQFENLWTIMIGGPYVVLNDDRLVVMTQNPDGSPRMLFDGFAEIPQLDLSSRDQHVTFIANHASVRCFDQPIVGRVQRNASLPAIFVTDGTQDVTIDSPCHFNPAIHSVGSLGGFLPNCTPFGFDTTLAPAAKIGAYPVFMESLSPWIAAIAVPTGTATYWMVGNAVRFLLAQNNPTQQYILNPSFGILDARLQDYYPAPGFSVMDPTNPASFVTQPVPIRDYDASNKPWPVAISELIAYCGFFMRWETTTSPMGLPVNQMKFYRRDEFSTTPVKSVYLATQGSVVGTAVNNLAAAHLAIDTSAIVNGWLVETAPTQIEVSIGIAPLFTPKAGDQFNGVRQQFDIASWTPNTSFVNRRKYRWFGADELGEGHNVTTASGNIGRQSTVPCNFTPWFPPNPVTGAAAWTQRYRPGYQTLVSLDSKQVPLKATLQIVMAQSAAVGPVGSDPGPINQAFLAANFPGTVYDIPRGWQLLPDCLGIEVTVPKINEWATGNDKFPMIRGIEWWTDPPVGAPTWGWVPVLILTTTIDADLTIGIIANPRMASPTSFPRYRVADGRDHFKYTSVDISSRYYIQMGGNGVDPFVVRDDTKPAQAHADQLRSSHEFPRLAGSPTIPYLATQYGIGHRIKSIAGRNVPLTTNLGNAPVYPWIVGISYSLENDRQQTTLQLSDARAEKRNNW